MRFARLARERASNSATSPLEPVSNDDSESTGFGFLGNVGSPDKMLTQQSESLSIRSQRAELESYASTLWPQDDKLDELLNSQIDFANDDFNVLFGDAKTAFEAIDSSHNAQQYRVTGHLSSLAADNIPQQNADSTEDLFDLASSTLAGTKNPQQDPWFGVQESFSSFASPAYTPLAHVEPHTMKKDDAESLHKPSLSTCMNQLGYQGSVVQDVRSLLHSLSTRPPSKCKIATNSGINPSVKKLNSLDKTLLPIETLTFFGEILRCHYEDFDHLDSTSWDDFFAVAVPALIPVAELERVDRFGNTLLHCVASNNPPISILSAIMSRVSDINKINTRGQTFMHVLNPSRMDADEHYAELLYELLACSFDFRHVDVYGSTCLHYLHLRPNLSVDYLSMTSDVIYDIVQSTPALLGLRNHAGRCLQEEIQANGPGGYYFIKHFAKPRDLLQSELSTKIEVLRRAVEKNEAYALSTTENEFNGLHCLLELLEPLYIFKEFAEQRQDLGHDETLLLARKFVDAGIALDDYNAYGRTALHMALFQAEKCPDLQRQTYEAIAMLLIERGANVNLRSTYDCSPLFYAVRAGFINCTTLLLKKGANPNATDRYGNGVVNVDFDYYKSPTGMTDAQRLRIMACQNLVIDAGGVERPTFEDEWSLEQRSKPHGSNKPKKR